MDKEINELKSELSRISLERDKYYEVLIKIKNSFYQTNVYNQLKEAADEGASKEYPAEERAASST